MRFAFVALLLAIPLTQTPWIDSAEAYFATRQERVEWMQLSSDAERQQFVERYWLKRDPSPGTAKNEFREAIMDRIRKADAKFRFENTRGSETARGFVHVVFGPPARFRTGSAPPAVAPRLDVPGQTYTPTGTADVGETYETWIYDRERTPRLMEMIDLPTLTLEFVIRPQKHIDELQAPGLAYDLRDKLALRSVVNADAGLAPAATAAPIASAHSGATIPAAVAAALENAGPPNFASPAGYFAHNTRWSAKDEPRTTVWFAATPQAKLAESGRFVGRIVRADGSVATAFSEPLIRSDALRAFSGAPVYALDVALPPGEYTGALAITDAAGETLADAVLPMHVADAAAPLSVSSILLSTTPGRAAGGAFDVAALGIIPRADQTFSRAESLWYAGEVTSASDPKAITIDVMLRSGAKVLGTSRVALEAQPVAAHRYLFARELPLSTFEPGDYSLYVTARDGAGAAEVRRADFRIVP